MKEKLNQFKAEFAKEIFKKADEGAISKEVALDLLTAQFPDLTWDEAINELYEFVKEKQVIGCVYDW